MQEVFNLNRIDVFSTSDNNILFPVYQVNKSVFIHHGHITCVKPAIFVLYFCSCFRVFVVFNHYTRTKYSKFTNIPLFYFIAFFINNANFPAVTGNTNGTNFVIISNTKVYTSWTNRFRKTIVCIIIMMWEIFFPVFNQFFRNRLSSNVHKSPLIKMIIFNIYIAFFKSNKNILSPGNQKPYNSTFFFTNSFQDCFRFCSTK